MGSWQSGRSPEKVTVESGLTLDLGRLLRQSNVKLGAHVRGSIIWTYTETGKQKASIGFEANLIDPHGAWLRLHYSVNDAPQDYRVWMRRTQCNLGGFRWWFVCPSTGHNCTKLYLPPGGTLFLGRRAYRMAYLSERGGPTDRSHRRQSRLYAKLGKDYRIFDRCPPRRPKGMHQRTYKRLRAELEQAIDLHNDIFMAGLTRILAKDPTMRERLGL